MTTIAAAPSALRSRVPAWGWLVLAAAVLTLYVLSQDSTALLGASTAARLHELTHDARHALGVPCH